MSAVSEVKTVTSIRDNMSAGLKAIQKEQLRIKKEIQETKEVLKDTFGKKWSIKLQSIELLRQIREVGKEIGLLRKQLVRMLQGLKTNKSSVENRTAINKIKFVTIGFNIKSIMPCKCNTAKTAEKSESRSPIDNIIKYASEKISSKEVKASIKNLSKSAIKIPISVALWPIKKALSIIKTLTKSALALAAIVVFKKSGLLEKLPKNAFKLSFLVETSKTLRRLKPIFSILNRLSTIGIDIRPKQSGVKNMMGKMTSGLKSAGGAVLGFAKSGLLALGDIAAKGISEAVKSGAELEKQNLFMDQAITSNNSQMSEKDVKKQRHSYMKQLRDSAAGTGMDSADVIAAGTQAVSITGGDTKEAMELVKVAQDMAAMNPGKTVAEAMEALAAAKSGDVAGLEEFKANISSEDIKNYGFKGAVQQKLKPQFAGGAEKLSGTGAGLVPVIKGKLNNKLQDMGLSIIEKLKPALESVVKLIDRYSPALDAFGEGIASGIGLAIEWVQKFAGLIGEKFSWIGEKSGFLKEVFLASWEGIKNGMAAAWEFIQPIMDLIANGAMLLFNIFQWAFPGIQAVIENVWAFVQPIFEGLGGVIGWVADKVGMVAERFDKKNDSSSGADAIWSKKEEALAKKQPVIPTRPVDALRTPAMMGASPQNGNDGMNRRLKTYAVPQVNSQSGKPSIQNLAFKIIINGINKSTNEIINEMVPQIRLALVNASSGSSGNARFGGALA